MSRLAVFAVALSLLAAGCGLTRSSQSTAAPKKPAAVPAAGNPRTGGPSTNDTIPNAAAVGL